MGGREAGSVWDGDVMFLGSGRWGTKREERGVKEAGKAGWQRWNPLAGCPLSAPPSDHKLIVMPSASSLSLHPRVHLLGHELS